MRFSLFAIAGFAASLVTGAALPFEDAEDVATREMADAVGITLRPRGVLQARDSYDCKGSSICSTLNVAACNRAVNDLIIRNNDVNYGAPGSGRRFTGACAKVFDGYGCGVFIQGKSHCARSGNEIWWDYQDIRNNGCRVCGSKHWGDGCLTTINYVSHNCV